MWAAEKLGEQHAGLAEPLVVALKASEDEVEIFGLDRSGERLRGVERVKLEKLAVGNVNAAVRTLGEGFLDGLLGALGAHGNGDDFAAVLFLQAQGFFERKAVGLVGFKADVGLSNPRAFADDRKRRVFRGDLLHANSDFHGQPPTWVNRNLLVSIIISYFEPRHKGASSACRPSNLCYS